LFALCTAGPQHRRPPRLVRLARPAAGPTVSCLTLQGESRFPQESADQVAQLVTIVRQGDSLTMWLLSPNEQGSRARSATASGCCSPAPAPRLAVRPSPPLLPRRGGEGRARTVPLPLRRGEVPRRGAVSALEEGGLNAEVRERSTTSLPRPGPLQAALPARSDDRRRGHPPRAFSWLLQGVRTTPVRRRPPAGRQRLADPARQGGAARDAGVPDTRRRASLFDGQDAALPAAVSDLARFVPRKSCGCRAGHFARTGLASRKSRGRNVKLAHSTRMPGQSSVRGRWCRCSAYHSTTLAPSIDSLFR
jgi:hypothetical protein